MYGLEYQTRCLSSVSAETNRHQFWVGTFNAKGNNEIHLIDYTEDSHSVSCVNIYPHQHEIWSITPSPQDRDVFISTYYKDDAYGASMWRCAGGEQDMKTKSKITNGGKKDKPAETSLTSMVDFDGHQGNIKAFVWHSGTAGEGENTTTTSPPLVSVDDLGLHLWNLPEGTSSVSTSQHAHLLPSEHTADACFDPHHDTTLVSVDGRNIRGWDTRQLKETQLVARAHEDAIRSIDYNPNKPYHIVTGGDDRRVCLWDLRKPSNPLKILASHTHWVWTVRFNRFHDQLILSAGTELVNLWSIVSVSSAPLGELEEQQDASSDKLIKTYADHDDSIYSIAWSSFDAWCFASLSYDGRVVINQVPAAEKYKILL